MRLEECSTISSRQVTAFFELSILSLLADIVGWIVWTVTIIALRYHFSSSALQIGTDEVEAFTLLRSVEGKRLVRLIRDE